jgi:hypothetical protein
VLPACACGCGTAVELAVGGQRQCRQRQHMGRHLVGREPFAQISLEAVGLQRCVGRQYHVRHQLGAIGTGLAADHALVHLAMGQQLLFDFAGLDPVTANLHLLVATAQVLQLVIGALAHAVAGAVQALAVAERVGDKALGGQPGLAQVATGQARAAQVQLALAAQRRLLQGAIEHLRAQVGQRRAERRGAAQVIEQAGEHAHRGFGRPIVVDQGAAGARARMRCSKAGGLASPPSTRQRRGSTPWLSLPSSAPRCDGTIFSASTPCCCM